MPALAAEALTASSNGLGNRMLTRSLLGWNSNKMLRNSERSYSVKSALATNSSASSSVRSCGSFFFIMVDLLPTHVAGADRPDYRLVITHPQGQRRSARRAHPQSSQSP